MATRTASSVGPQAWQFARRLQATLGAERVLLFGDHIHGNADPDSDYEFIIVAAAFQPLELWERERGLRQHWYDVGGDGPLSLRCFTPEEFEQARGRISLVSAVLPEAIDLLPPTPTESASVA